MEGVENSKGGKMDRLSSLPDCLLHLIMSFMATQEAVQTCVLSKRWKNLWTTLPYLNFTFDPITQSMMNEDDGYEEWMPGKRFRDFVSTALLLRERSDVHTFRLSCVQLTGYDMSIDSWISYVLKNNPKVLHIRISSKVVPIGGVFTCSSLEDVSFTVRGYEPSTGVIGLPHLKRLYLADILLNQDFVEKLFRGCPAIETLHFYSCILKFTTINSCSLKYLTIFGLCSEMGKKLLLRKKKREMGKELELISAPNLLSFEYLGCTSYLGLRAVLNLPSLTNAKIRTYNCPDHRVCKVKGNILIGISKVQNLELSGVMVKEVLENELPKFPNFQNLKVLCVHQLCLSCDFGLLSSLLDHCPNLGKLSLLHHACWCTMHKEHGNQELLKIAPFQCKELKILEVKLCRCDKDLPRIVKNLKDGVGIFGTQINVSTFPDSCYFSRRTSFSFPL